VRREVRDLPIYAVTVAKGGPKLQKAAVQEKDCAENPKSPTIPRAASPSKVDKDEVFTRRP
jgi:uncharacterized protein (TIGR03435 family)